MSSGEPTEKQNGGPRPGSGRKPGSPETKSRSIAVQLATKYATPLETMLKMIAQHETNLKTATTHFEKLVDEEKDLSDESIKKRHHFKRADFWYKEMLRYEGLIRTYTQDAAPYIHPKMPVAVITQSDGAPGAVSPGDETILSTYMNALTIAEQLNAPSEPTTDHTSEPAKDSTAAELPAAAPPAAG